MTVPAAISPLVVLITGVTARGLGASLALELAKTPLQYKVYGSLRSLAKSEDFHKEAKDKGIDSSKVGLLEFDVTNQESCAKAIQELIAKEGRIDVLVNNAGAGYLQTIESATPEQIQNCFDVNFFSVYRMSTLVLPHMRAQNTGRIINVSSIGGIMGQGFNEIYCAAKAATDSLAESMNMTLWKWNITVSSFCPGAITSAFAGSAMKTITGQEIPEDYKPLMDDYFKAVQARFSLPESAKFRQTPEECAADIVTIIKTEKPSARYITENVQEWAAVKLQPGAGDAVVDFFRSRYFPA
ncbi:hypothetical protein DFJ77DRAFT_216033 [Powellomyces hirtus]|nr:hypothetical protein DFJ77DRAFT_216033 [Powellomyces hirtus]